MSTFTLLWEGAAATVVLWFISAGMALALAVALACGLGSASAGIRMTAALVTNVSRGVPTSLYVLAFGFFSMGAVAWIELPVIFPGTVAPFQVIALAVAVALAFGSAGHIAKICEASWCSLPSESREQLKMLCLAPAERARLLACECAETVLPPLSARLVHHLHNTALAALFPIGELFGVIQSSATTSARVVYFVTIGACVYVLLSSIIWFSLRLVEGLLVPSARTRLMRAAA